MIKPEKIRLDLEDRYSDQGILELGQSTDLYLHRQASSFDRGKVQCCIDKIKLAFLAYFVWINGFNEGEFFGDQDTISGFEGQG